MSPSTTEVDRMLTNLEKHPQHYHPTMDLTIIVRFPSGRWLAWVLIWTMKVGNVCFRQASYFFTRESHVFRDRLAEDTGKNKTTNHTGPDSANSDVCAGHILIIKPDENVSPDDFAELCSIFDNPYASVLPSFGPENANIQTGSLQSSTSHLTLGRQYCALPTSGPSLRSKHWLSGNSMSLKNFRCPWWNDLSFISNMMLRKHTSSLFMKNCSCDANPLQRRMVRLWASSIHWKLVRPGRSC